MSRIYGCSTVRGQGCRGRTVGGVLLLSVLWATRAQAYEEQVSVDLSAGYALVTDAPELTHTGGADVGIAYGLGPALSLRGALGGQAWGAPRGGVRPAARALAELTYALDILSFVPALGIGGSATVLARAGGQAGDALRVLGGGHIVFSLDYLASRRLSVGLDLREHALFPLGKPSFASEAKLRVSWLFELF